jgi:hypothetical protein
MPIYAGNTTTFIAGSWPAGKAYALTPNTAGTADSGTRFVLPSVTGSLTFGQLLPASQSFPGFQVAVATPTSSSWIFSNGGTPATITQPIGTIMSGTWTISLRLSLTNFWSGSYNVAFRAYQTNASFTTASLLSLVAPTGGSGPDVNGWVSSSAVVPGASSTVTTALVMQNMPTTNMSGNILAFELGIVPASLGTSASVASIALLTASLPPVDYSYVTSNNASAATNPSLNQTSKFPFATDAVSVNSSSHNLTGHKYMNVFGPAAWDTRPDRGSVWNYVYSGTVHPLPVTLKYYFMTAKGNSGNRVFWTSVGSADPAGAYYTGRDLPLTGAYVSAVWASGD